MGLFKKQKGSRKSRPRGDSMDIYVKCEKCGEIIKTHIVKGHELIPTYEDEGPAYLLKKELIGSNCPNRVQLSMEFDSTRRVLSKSVSGGTFEDMKELSG